MKADDIFHDLHKEWNKNKITTLASQDRREESIKFVFDVNVCIFYCGLLS